eukprot:CAMPEP_0194212462 /NCGR_PEP_ID=MMETSP0156-20130528/12385_1 /TAXON_ID=33649 /ORGANISM="Thalassionema nitzschioides, Strain L26-B" /LENGTH=302 /DNA_ID=CAMNT_0038940297 /DNA_START=87 /DNA_END=995 /DNA_ORIENTATION=+
MTATKRRRSCAIKTLAAAASALSGALYCCSLAYDNEKNRSAMQNKAEYGLINNESWQLIQAASSLQRRPIDWDRLIKKDADIVLRRLGDQRRRQLQEMVPIPEYNYDAGNCPESGSQGVPCAPSDLSKSCNKKSGQLSRCLTACLPSFCCIHDTPAETNGFAANCNTDENCAQYAPCYIAWWKLQDMVGPATELQLAQNDDFFDVDILQDVTTDEEFYQQLLFHHFEDIQPILDLFQAGNDINEIFEMPEVWDADSVLSMLSMMGAQANSISPPAISFLPQLATSIGQDKKLKDGHSRRITP